jgi:HTH-type transcriptional regulator / antitoxin HigA
MEIKILKTEEEYEAALERIEALMEAEPGSPEGEELELLALLVEKYEDEHYPISLPGPVEAIKFRMDQEGLEPKDMIPYLGSQSKVSEVLNYKRPLSLAMIRALHEGLGIPAEVLLQEMNGPKTANPAYSWKNYPFAEMFKRGYFSRFNDSLGEAKKHSDELLEDLLAAFQGRQFVPVYCRHADRPVQEYALKAWQARSIRIAQQQEIPRFSRDQLTEERIREIVHLSFYSQGPKMAVERLNSLGIHFVILRHLPKTYLDGACFYTPERQPLIAMTLRYDRLDNFWFTLVHELAHLYLHLDDANLAFFDDTESVSEDPELPQEIEADRFTRDALVPAEFWEQAGSALIEAQDAETILEAARTLGVGPEIIAGRVRWESGDYTRFTELVGNKKIRSKFETLNS